MKSFERFAALPLLVAGAVLFYAGRELPRVGSPDSPASLHVSPRYIENAYRETGAPNMVTAVLADYRSYDTLGETVVIFTAGLACLLVLGAFRVRGEEAAPRDQMDYSFGSDVLDATSRILIPFLVLFAVYVVVHGHTSPGGGFQGGTILAAALILLRLVRGSAEGVGISLKGMLVIASAGVGLYASIGLVSLVFGRNFLDYAGLPIPYEGGHLRELGSLGIEVGVFLGVTAVLVLIFDALTTGAEE
ncbi:MAG TPA: hydrogen gas-evolving membrane-bound hydrogenase subunit E [Vicinamibacteria bacterium]|nr:hydrogen gas-evolving membrane-bound hydrogenase subunit E [Vicinamibacteria bacterium]